jgi:hypothetical protein
MPCEIKVCVITLAIFAYLEIDKWQVFLKLWKYATQTFKMLKAAFGEYTMGRTQVFTNFTRSKVV